MENSNKNKQDNRIGEVIIASLFLIIVFTFINVVAIFYSTDKATKETSIACESIMKRIDHQKISLNTIIEHNKQIYLALNDTNVKYNRLEDNILKIIVLSRVPAENQKLAEQIIEKLFPEEK